MGIDPIFAMIRRLAVRLGVGQELNLRILIQRERRKLAVVFPNGHAPQPILVVAAVRIPGAGRRLRDFDDYA